MKNRRVVSQIIIAIFLVITIVGRTLPVAALTANSIVGSGANWAGMLSDGTTTDRYVPVNFQLPTGATVKKFLYGLGGGEAVFLTTDGRVFGVGWNAYGQLGDGTTNDASTPVQMILPPGTIVSDILGDNASYYIVTNDGKVYFTGYNYRGSAADGTTNDVSTPELWPLPVGAVASKVLSNNGSVLILTTDGRVFGAGSMGAQFGSGLDGSDTSLPQQFQLPGGVTATNIWLGSHTFVMGSDGKLYTAGGNLSGELATGSTAPYISTPVVVTPPGGRSIVDVFSYGVRTVFYKMDDGSLYGAGYNGKGELGNGNTTDQSTLTQYPLPVGASVDKVVTDYANMVAVLTTDGRIFASGNNFEDEMGQGVTSWSVSSPVQIPYPVGAHVAQLVFGSSSLYAIMADGRLFATGMQSFGQLGNGVASTASVSGPLQITLPGNPLVADVSTTNSSVGVLTTDGKVYAFGMNPNGQLGDGTTNDILTPFLYPVPAQLTPESLVVRDNNVFVLGSVAPVTPAPQVLGVSVSIANSATTLNVTGTNFTGATQVTVGSTPISLSPCPANPTNNCFTVLNDSSLTVWLNTVLTSPQTISITTSAGSSPVFPFSFTTPQPTQPTPAPSTGTLAPTGDNFMLLVLAGLGTVIITAGMLARRIARS